MFTIDNLESEQKNTVGTFIVLLPLDSGLEELVRSFRRIQEASGAGTPDWLSCPTFGHAMGTSYVCMVLKQHRSASVDHQQMAQASSQLWPLLDVGVRHTMGIPHVPAAGGSPRVLVALQHGGLRLHISLHLQGHLHWCPPSLCQGKASPHPGARLLYSLGSWGRLICQSDALQGMLVFLKL